MWAEAKTHNADILCIQETHFQELKTPKCSHKDFPHVFLACTPGHKRGGVLIALRNTLSFQLQDVTLDPNGRYIILKGDINSHPYTLVALYAPNSHQVCFPSRLLRKVRAHQYGNLVLCGDFNHIVDPSLDTSTKKPKGSTRLGSLMHREELYDAWRCIHAGLRDIFLYFFFSQTLFILSY